MHDDASVLFVPRMRNDVKVEADLTIIRGTVKGWREHAVW